MKKAFKLSPMVAAVVLANGLSGAVAGTIDINEGTCTSWIYTCNASIQADTAVSAQTADVATDALRVKNVGSAQVIGNSDGSVGTEGVWITSNLAGAAGEANQATASFSTNGNATITGNNQATLTSNGSATTGAAVQVTNAGIAYVNAADQVRINAGATTGDVLIGNGNAVNTISGSNNTMTTATGTNTLSAVANKIEASGQFGTNAMTAGASNTISAGTTNTITGGTGNVITATTGNNSMTATAGANTMQAAVANNITSDIDNNLTADGANNLTAGANNITATGTNTISGNANVMTSTTMNTITGATGNNMTATTGANTISAIGANGTNTINATTANTITALTNTISGVTNSMGNLTAASTNAIGTGTQKSTNAIGNTHAATTVVSVAGNASQALANGTAATTVREGVSALTARTDADGNAVANAATTAEVLLTNAQGASVDANGKLTARNAEQASPTAALTLTNGYGNTHGIVVTESQTTISGGTQSSSMTLADNGATFSNAETGAPVQVHGVADGTADFDAINVRQFAGAIAAVTAQANIPSLAAGQDKTIGVGLGHFMGKTGLAVGMNLRGKKNGIYKLSVSTGLNGGAKFVVGGGAAWSF